MKVKLQIPNSYVKQEITMELRKYLEVSENKNVKMNIQRKQYSDIELDDKDTLQEMHQ